MKGVILTKEIKRSIIHGYNGFLSTEYTHKEKFEMSKLIAAVKGWNVRRLEKKAARAERMWKLATRRANKEDAELQIELSGFVSL
jgi:hypothetical protein